MPSASASAVVAASDSAPSKSKTMVVVENATDKQALVFVTFGADSAVRPTSGWKFCWPDDGPLLCRFSLASRAKQELPTGGKYLNATVTFDAPATCGSTKGEVNANNPAWYDTADVSLVDGFSNFVVVVANGTRIVPHGKTGNEKAFGVYPIGCDICVASQQPPCGMSPGKDGCKAGTQYQPTVPCQYQGPTMGGGGLIQVMLVEPVPAGS
jgi:hypothetical protein